MLAIDRRAPSVALACAIGVLTAGCQATPCQETAGSVCAPDLADADGATGWREERSFPIPQGVMIEAEIGMVQGDSIRIEYTSVGGPVAWDVHTHDGDQLPVHAQGRDTEGSFDFVAPADGIYFSRWTNDGAATLDVDVAFQGRGSAVFRGWL